MECDTHSDRPSDHHTSDHIFNHNREANEDDECWNGRSYCWVVGRDRNRCGLADVNMGMNPSAKE